MIGADRPPTGKADQPATINAKMAFSGGTTCLTPGLPVPKMTLASESWPETLPEQD
jgi:hypothetical protein